MKTLELFLSLLLISSLVVLQSCTVDDDNPSPTPDPTIEEFSITYKTTTIGNIGTDPTLSYKDKDGVKQTLVLPLGDWEKEITFEKGDSLFLETTITTDMDFSVYLGIFDENNSNGSALKTDSTTISNPSMVITKISTLEKTL